jgi:hypothetical protein
MAQGRHHLNGSLAISFSSLPPGRSPDEIVGDAFCYTSGMDPLLATIEEFAAAGFTHVQCHCPRCRVIRLRPISWLPGISMGLTVAQLSARLRCAECGGQVHSVKPWRVDDFINKPVGRGG